MSTLYIQYWAKLVPQAIEGSSAFKGKMVGTHESFTQCTTIYCLGIYVLNVFLEKEKVKVVWDVL